MQVAVVTAVCIAYIKSWIGTFGSSAVQVSNPSPNTSIA